MSIVLTNNQKKVIDAIESPLDDAYLNGVQNPDTSSNVAALSGYDKISSIGNPPVDYRNPTKAPFKSLIAAFLQSIESTVTVSSFQNGWGNVAGYNPAGYYVDSFSVVHLQGYILGTPNTVAFNLPVNYRPLHTVIVPGALASGLLCSISIAPSGNVTPLLVSECSLEGITFRTP